MYLKTMLVVIHYISSLAGPPSYKKTAEKFNRSSCESGFDKWLAAQGECLFWHL